MTSVLILLSGFDPGTYFIEDDGIPNNGIAQLRGPDDSVIFFNIPTEFLTVTASAGRSIVFNLTETFGAADINVGNLTNAAENPDSITVRTIAGAGDVLLVSNGGITENGSDASADISSSTLILSAQTGVGTGANALETQVGTLEAETVTGGINISNIGNLTIGGLSTEVSGLFVDTSGNILITNSGGIDLNDETGLESVRGGSTSGHVTLIANGFDSDIRSLVDIDSIAAPAGSITLTAGRDVSLGTQGLNFDNDVRARGNLIINTGRDLNVDGFADLASDGFGAGTGGDVIVNAGRDINVLNATGTDGSIGAEGSGGADVILTTGPGGFVRLLATSTSTLFSSTGDVTVNADRMLISTVSGITASSGQVSIAPISEGWNIDLGSVTDGAFALEISDAELDRIFTPTLDIGTFASGTLTVSSGISPAAATNLVLRASTDLYLNASATITGFLTMQAGDNLFQIGASTITAGGALNAFVDELGDDGNIGGTVILNGAIVAASATLNGESENDSLNGSGADESMFGNAGDDTLSGFGGADTLVGGSGIDTMIGGLGNDLYIIDTGSDIIQEAVGEGFDTVQSGISYALSANVEQLTLTGASNLNGTGNDIANTIFGTSGQNVLNGGADADTLVGGAGDDTYVVDNSADVITELPGEGTDLVNSSAATFTLGANVENLTLTGGGNINGTGNGQANIINGNGSANVLNGANGADTLNGGGGDDTLNGSLGIDTMAGGLGNDTYVVDVAGDILTEAAAAGTDTVETALTFTLAANFENLTLTGAAAINGTGNSVDNVLIGNTGANILDGAAGADTMQGGAGDDTFIVDNVGDEAVEISAAHGVDLVNASVTFTLGDKVENLTLTGVGAINGTGNLADNIITGNTAANILNGAAGADTMQGGAGDDTYVVDNVADQAVEISSSHGVDLVNASVSFTLAAKVENLTLTGVGAIDGTGNLGDNNIIGNSGANVLNGAAGADIMEGRAGDDTYIVDNVLDQAVEISSSHGVDQVNASVSFTLAAKVENLTLTGVGAINGTGNLGDNIITGNTAANILDGASGADTMQGGAGDDTYIVDNVGDQAVEVSSTHGVDQVDSSVTFTLAAKVENLTLTGVAAIDGTGNLGDNLIIGNSAANVLNGAQGADTMQGGAGDDTYIVDNVGDQAVEVSSTHGVDQVNASVTFTLGTKVENLTLTGASAINGTGNLGDNIIIGNTAANVLDGDGGADHLFGGAGNDDLEGGADADNYYFDTALNAATNVDDILDFSETDDRIQLDRDIFAISADGFLSAPEFRAGTAAVDADDRIIYDAVTGNIFYDSDGVGGVAQILFATVDPGLALNRLDFIAYTD